MKQIKKKDVKFSIGDFIFTFRDDKIISETIALLTKSKVSHIANVLDNEYVTEARGDKFKKVVKSSIDEMFKEEGIHIYIAIPKIKPIISDDEYHRFLVSKIGIKYDYKNIFSTQIIKILFGRTLFGGQHSEDEADNKYICSEYSSQAMYVRYGILSDWYEKQYSPEELMRLNRYFTYYEIV